MNYHTIMHDDMRNGDGLRVVLFVSGCDHNCPECHNPQTHDPSSGKLFDEDAFAELCKYLEKDYIDGITLSGGDPLYGCNLNEIHDLIAIIRNLYPNKTIWLYTGYTYEALLEDEKRLNIASLCDVVVEGPFIPELKDQKYKWAGSTNQRVIDMKKTLKEAKLVLYE